MRRVRGRRLASRRLTGADSHDAACIHFPGQQITLVQSVDAYACIGWRIEA